MAPRWRAGRERSEAPARGTGGVGRAVDGSEVGARYIGRVRAGDAVLARSIGTYLLLLLRYCCGACVSRWYYDRAADTRVTSDERVVGARARAPDGARQISRCTTFSADS